MKVPSHFYHSSPCITWFLDAPSSPHTAHSPALLPHLRPFSLWFPHLLPPVYSVASTQCYSNPDHTPLDHFGGTHQNWSSRLVTWPCLSALPHLLSASHFLQLLNFIFMYSPGHSLTLLFAKISFSPWLSHYWAHSLLCFPSRVSKHNSRYIIEYPGQCPFSPTSTASSREQGFLSISEANLSLASIISSSVCRC